MRGIEGRSDLLRRATEAIRRAEESRRAAEARPSELAGALARALSDANASATAGLLVEVQRLSQEGQRVFFAAAAPEQNVTSAIETVRARIQESFPEGSEGRAELGEALARHLPSRPTAARRHGRRDPALAAPAPGERR